MVMLFGEGKRDYIDLGVMAKKKRSAQLYALPNIYIYEEIYRISDPVKHTRLKSQSSSTSMICFTIFYFIRETELI